MPVTLRPARSRHHTQRSRSELDLRLSPQYVILTAMEPQQETSRYDAAAPRRSHRKSARETGVWVYIPAAELRAIKRDPSDAPPTYRIFSMSKNSLNLRFYD